ncbi:hypothetical protein TNCT_435941 [Trichonephila clavata]|uniref:Uncharacterized protein n=1 Tax=Trichonephila clavata TaxID=2740835 RepID=A0A8X6F278_TRICU|nr:hypothetical protein TNCT_435941 [Trichonephila clavata]
MVFNGILPRKVYELNKCRCECQKGDEIEKCQKLNKIWDPTNCECVCPPGISQICSIGSYFNNELCRCVPLSERYPEYGKQRRRPPPV